MFAVMGVTGNVGGHLARTLLAAGEKVRAVVRDAAKGEAWAGRGCEVSIADVNDAAALASAFEGADGVFAMLPPVLDPAPGFPEARAFAANVRQAIEQARPGRVVYLSTIGAQSAEMNLLTQHTIVEAVFKDLPVPNAFLRPGWFMENFKWDVAPARDNGVLPSFLHPVDKAFPMVATADVGRVAAELLRGAWTGRRVVELEGPRRVSPNEVAEAFAALCGHPVRVELAPRDNWEPLFRSQGMTNPEPRIQMLEGFNDGWINYEIRRAR